MFATYCRLNVNVWASNREVIKAASLKLKKDVRYSRAHRATRHAFYRDMLSHHAGQQRLCAHFHL